MGASNKACYNYNNNFEIININDISLILISHKP